MDAHHQSCGVANVEDGVEFYFTLEAAGQPDLPTESEEERV